jgi:G3E family GTPase
MTAEIYIISGFLGAGKTTFIRKLLDEVFTGQRVVVIENDFGEISVDAALLKTGGIEVKELNSGCICCSLSGDFVKAVKDIISHYKPEIIVIEPSGVGKLSDVVRACGDKSISPLLTLAAKITVADVGRCKTYLDNFGEFFEDQIETADAVLLSRTENYPDKVPDTRGIIGSLNPGALIFAEPWSRISSGDILAEIKSRTQTASAHCHEDCGHDHSAEEVFDTVTVRTDRKYRQADLESCMLRAERGISGTILRAKGIVRGMGGYLEMQYIPGSLSISGSKAKGDMLSFIGKGLDKRELTAIFEGK